MEHIKDYDRKAQLSQRIVSSGNPSHAKQENLYGESMVQQKKKLKEKTRETLNTFFGKHDIFAAPHTGQPQIGIAANFCCISCPDGCRQDIPKASETGKLHVNAN